MGRSTHIRARPVPRCHAAPPIYLAPMMPADGIRRPVPYSTWRQPMAPRPFTAAEDAYLAAHYATESLAAMADALKRPWGSVQQHIALLIRRGVINPRQRHYQPGWTEAERAYLRAHW